MPTVAAATVGEAQARHHEHMETNSSTATQTTNRAMSGGQVVRVLTTALCAAAFVVMMAFGAPDEQGSRWDDGVDAHSEIGFDVTLDTIAVNGD